VSIYARTYLKNFCMNKIFYILALTPLLHLTAYGEDLESVYQKAAKNNAGYQASYMTYQAAAENIPIAFGTLLPNISITNANLTRNLKTHEDASGFNLNATQQIFNYTDWATYTQAQYQLKEDALTYNQALQNLINTAATDYFNVLEAQEQLKYANANLLANKENLDQAEQQYKVGLKALTDVQSAKATYESALATQIDDINQVQDALETLSAVTGTPENNLSPLKTNFTKITPSPADPQAWSNTALKHNLSILLAAEQVQIDQAGVQVQKSNFYPTLEVTGQEAYAHAQNTNTNIGTASLVANWNVFTGFSTVHSVSQANLTKQSDQETYLQTQRNITSQTQSDYLTVLSDIAQISAYQQAVISGEASVTAAKAQYQVGTTTIYDLLQEQAKLFSAEQQYASAQFQYIQDSLKLKTDAGLLSPTDITAINQWLETSSQETSSQEISKHD